MKLIDEQSVDALRYYQLTPRGPMHVVRGVRRPNLVCTLHGDALNAFHSTRNKYFSLLSHTTSSTFSIMGRFI